MKNLAVLTVLTSLIFPNLVLANDNNIWIASYDQSNSFEIAQTNSTSGMSLAVADLGNDNVSEMIVGNGMGNEPRVYALRQDGSEIGSFLAYDETLGVGINVVTCDITGDGYNEIITSPQRGGGPHIRIFNRYGQPIDNGGFFAYEENMREGVNLACGQLTENEQDQLVTLPAAGGGAHVRVWSWNDEIQMQENFFAFHSEDNSGLVGTVHDKKIFLAQQFTSSPTLKQFVIHNGVENISEEIFSIDGLGLQSLIWFEDKLLATTSSTSSLYDFTNNTSSSLPNSHQQLATDGNELYYTTGRYLFSSKTDSQRITVDVSEQRLYAFEAGKLRNSFLISSGLNNATPLGEHSVLAKIPLVHYAWNYGENNPNNYDLGWIPYNLRFYPHIYIHYAPWHNNFGQQMSHGCVNVGLTDVQWLYDWANEGIPVEIKE